MIKRQDSRHGDVLRQAALQWLRDEDSYQWQKFSVADNQASLTDGVMGTIWTNELGNYLMRAALAAESGGRLQALQPAGKVAAAGRGLYAALLQLRTPGLDMSEASQITLVDLDQSFPLATRSDFDYTASSRSVRERLPDSPLWSALGALDVSLPRPVVSGGVGEGHVELARDVCLAAGQVFVDYLVMLCPEDEPLVLPQGGLPSGIIEAWRP
jgi:hypothetical protein